VSSFARISLYNALVFSPEVTRVPFPIHSLTLNNELDLLDAVKLLDKTPLAVHEYIKEAHHQHNVTKKKASLKHPHVHDRHSLRGKHGKTHGVC
jgi:hypothetical protein